MQLLQCVSVLLADNHMQSYNSMLTKCGQGFFVHGIVFK